MSTMEKELIKTIADISGFMPGSAFSLRRNGEGVERHSTQNIKIVAKAISRELIFMLHHIP